MLIEHPIKIDENKKVNKFIFKIIIRFIESASITFILEIRNLFKKSI